MGEIILSQIVGHTRYDVAERISQLCWSDEGTGYTFTYQEALQMSVPEIDTFLRIANRRKKAKNEAIERANAAAKGKSRKKG